MTDEKIIHLYWERSEEAIIETDKKYGNYCWSIAYGILRNHEDANECINDTYLNVWNSIPPTRPVKFAMYLGRITRNLAINKYNYYSAKKRHNTEVHLAINELIECVSGEDFSERIDNAIMIHDLLNSFLGDLNDIDQKIFVCRYWYYYSIKEIAKINGLTESYVKVSLHRSRNILKLILEREGIY